MFLLEDVRFGLRTFAKNPGFTVVAVVALALGIGVNATVFGIANGVLFKSMPFVGDRIMYVSTKNLARGQNRAGVSYADFRDWREQVKSFDGLGAFDFNVVNVSDSVNVPTRYNVGQVTANTFSVIGQKPILGRNFSPEDEKVEAPEVAILGFGIWETRYGKNPDILGQTIKINDVPTTVIGVMQRDLRFPIDRCPLSPRKNPRLPNWTALRAIWNGNIRKPIKALLLWFTVSARSSTVQTSGC